MSRVMEREGGRWQLVPRLLDHLRGASSAGEHR
jgi:hypothetical protein